MDAQKFGQDYLLDVLLRSPRSQASIRIGDSGLSSKLDLALHRFEFSAANLAEVS
jgi:hypothetical protein